MYFLDQEIQEIYANLGGVLRSCRGKISEIMEISDFFIGVNIFHRSNKIYYYFSYRFISCGGRKSIYITQTHHGLHQVCLKFD